MNPPSSRIVLRGLGLAAIALLSCIVQGDSCGEPKPVAQTPAAGNAAIDTDFGIATVKLDSPLEEFGQMENLGELSNGMVSYRRSGQNLPIGPVTVQDVTYVFSAGKLATIFIETARPEDAEPLRQFIEARWGRPQQSDGLKQWWLGTRAAARFELLEGGFGSLVVTRTGLGQGG